jgi:hypothetical protein
MSITNTQARDGMIGHVRTAWLADVASVAIPMQYPDVPGFVKPASGPWSRLMIQHVDGGKTSLGNANGQARYDRSGLLTVELFTKPNDGLLNADSLVKILTDALEGGKTTNGVNFLNVRFSELGKFETWEQTNVMAEFLYTEVK